MKLENIEAAIGRGYELLVKKHYSGKVHAMAWLGTMSSSHNHLGSSVEEATLGLDRYLASHLEPAVSAGDGQS